MHIINKWKPTKFSQVSTLFPRLLTYKSLLPLYWLLDLILVHILQSGSYHSLAGCFTISLDCRQPLLSTSGWESRRHFNLQQSGGTFYIMLLPNVTMKCALPTKIWLHTMQSYTSSLEAELDCSTNCTIQLWGEIDTPHQYSTSLITWSTTPCGIICFAFYILFCKGLKMIGSDKICSTASHTYVNGQSFCHLYPLPFTWRITNENFQKILSPCNSSHNFTPKRNELTEHCCLAITTVFHRALVSCCTSREIE
jgi:hypothetical protein